jgi:hypothetical protein
MIPNLQGVQYNISESGQFTVLFLDRVFPNVKDFLERFRWEFYRTRMFHERTSKLWLSASGYGGKAERFPYPE